MRRSILIAGMLVQWMPSPAVAKEFPDVVNDRERLLIKAEAGSGTRVARRGTSFRESAGGGGERAWVVSFTSIGGHSPADARFYDARKVHGQQAVLKFRHDVGPSATAGLAVSAGRTSRVDRLSPVFPAKSLSGSFEFGGDLRFKTGLALRGAWFSHGGWGGRSLEKDVVAMVDGDSAAKRGMRLAIELPVQGAGSVSTRLALEACDEFTAVPGTSLRLHASEVALRLASAF